VDDFLVQAQQSIGKTNDASLLETMLIEEVDFDSDLL